MGPTGWGSGARRGVAQSKQRNLLLFKVAAVLLVYQHQVEVILDAELVVHRLVCRRQVVRRQEQPEAAKRGRCTVSGLL